MNGSAVSGTRSAEADAQVEVYATLDALPPDAASLVDSATDLFAGRAWWRTVLAAAMPSGAAAEFVACRIGGRCVALFPLLRGDDGALSGLTTLYTCLYVPLLAPGLSPAASVAVFAAFGRYCRRSATTRLDAMPAEWEGLAPLAAGVRSAGLRVLRFDHFGNWHENVAGLRWSDYLARREGSLRETIRRKLRRAERLADARFEVVTGVEGLEAGVAAFESVYARSWKEPEPFPAFNAALIRAVAAGGGLRLGVWSLGAQPVAVQFWVVEGGRAAVLKLAHDEAFKTHSPGTVLTALMLRRMLDSERIDEIDFGRGDDPYKQGWATARRQRIGLLLVNPWRPAGLIQLARHTLGRVRAVLRR